MDTAQKYRVNLLKSQADMLKQVESSQNKLILELKKVVEYVDMCK